MNLFKCPIQLILSSFKPHQILCPEPPRAVFRSLPSPFNFLVVNLSHLQSKLKLSDFSLITVLILPHKKAWKLAGKGRCPLRKQGMGEIQRGKNRILFSRGLGVGGRGQSCVNKLAPVSLGSFMDAYVHAMTILWGKMCLFFPPYLLFYSHLRGFFPSK